MSAAIDMAKDQKQSPKELLKSLELSKDGCIYIVRDRVRWSFYIERGKLVYASHSL